MTSLKIQDLKIHPKNDYYFDDISGDKWERLLESIKNNGVRTPIIVTDNMIVVSGNQRVRACKELGISVINAEIEHYKNDDDVIRDLIEINIRQRGVIDDSEIKAGRRFEFLQRYYGVQNGNNQHRVPNNSEPSKSQEQIASESGVSVDTMQNYIKLSEMIPELRDLVDTGIVKPTTALAIIKQLPEEQQKSLAEKLSESGAKASLSKVNEEIRKIKAAKDKAEEELQDLREERDYLKSQVEELESREPGVKTVTKEVPPKDYVFLKKRQEEYVKEMDELTAKNKEEQKALKEQIAQLEKERETLLNGEDKAERDYSAKLKTDCIMFCTYISDFLKKTGGYMYLGREIDRLPETERKSYLSSVGLVRDWVDNMLNVTATEVIE